MLAIKKLAVLALATIALTWSPVALASQVDVAPRRLRSEPVRLLTTDDMAGVSIGGEDDAVGADFAEDEVRANNGDEDDSSEPESRGITDKVMSGVDKAKEIKDKAKEKIKEKAPAVKDKAKEIKEKAKVAKDKVKEKAKDVKDKAKEKAKGVKDKVKDKIKDKVPSAGGSAQPSADPTPDPASSGSATADTTPASGSAASERRY
jgi:ElaB/YqjD/DUF883 family membrane-anchored ribosome-binding protein